MLSVLFLPVRLLRLAVVWAMFLCAPLGGALLLVLLWLLALCGGGFVPRRVRFRVWWLSLALPPLPPRLRLPLHGRVGWVWRSLCAGLVALLARCGACLFRWSRPRLRFVPVRFRRVCLLLPGCVVFSSPGVVAVAGSRVLPASGSALVAQVLPVLAAGGVSFAVGCCSGADAALLATVSPSLVRCFAAFGAGGAGAGPFSAVASVSTFSGAGGCVQWWAGGSVFVPLRVRLARRTRAVVAAANVGLLVFFGSSTSRGSLLACQCAAARGLPVVAFPCGFSGALLPSLGAGSWVAVVGAGGVWSSAFLWVSAQQKCI